MPAPGPRRRSLDGELGRARPDHARLEPHLPDAARRRGRRSASTSRSRGSGRCGTSPTAPSPPARYAAYVVSEAARLGRRAADRAARRAAGPGMVQLLDRARDPTSSRPGRRRPEGEVPHGLAARARRDRRRATSRSSLVHEDSAPLRRMAVFDVVVNNADRKGGHVLPMPRRAPLRRRPRRLLPRRATSCAPCCGAGPASRSPTTEPTALRGGRSARRSTATCASSSTTC